MFKIEYDPKYHEEKEFAKKIFEYYEDGIITKMEAVYRLVQWKIEIKKTKND